MPSPFLALATDFDETIALDSTVEVAVFDMLAALKRSGRHLILATGRELPDLRRIFPDYRLFDRIVAENGAVILDPSTGRERLLGAPPPAAFVAHLRDRQVAPLSVGRSVVATREPNLAVVLEAIRACSLDLRIVFNKGGVMVLPGGIDKASGVRVAADELGVPLRAVVGVGDAENDHALLKACGCSAAVANALPALKETVSIVLDGCAGEGVVELIGRIWGAGVGASARKSLRMPDAARPARQPLQPVSARP
jgi:hydroxymethylpyrimidine pyrophosphatase-like HAD family hydrolase